MGKPKRERLVAQRARSTPSDAEAQRSRAVVRLARWDWIALGAILVFGLVLRIVYLTEIDGSPAFRYPAYDAAFNDYWARCLASGEWSAPEFYPDPQIQDTPFFRPPGYPYFLAGVYVLTGQSYLGARIVQMLMGLASVVLAFMLGRSFFGCGVSLFFAALVSCYWLFVYFEGELQAPVLMVFLTLATMNMLARWLTRTTYANTIAAGLLLGVLALVMPNALVLAPVALVWIWWVARRRGDPRRFRVALLGFPIGVVLAIAPATIRNYAVADDLVLITSNAGINLYIGNNEHTDCVTANAPILGEATALGSWTCFDEPAITAAVEKIEGRPLKSSEVSRFFIGKALDHIARHPGKTMELTGKKALLFWGPAEISNNEVLRFERTHSRALRFLPGFPLALALAIVGVALLFFEFRAARRTKGKAGAASSRRFELTMLFLAFIAVYFASYLPFFIAGRYRVPVIPLLLLFGAYGIERVRSMAAGRRLTDGAIWIGVFVAAYFGTTRQFVEYRANLGMWHFLRGDAYRKQGNVERARVEFQQAIESSGEPNPLAYNNLGVALDQLGHPEEAVKSFERALELKPRFLDARRNLVAVLFRMNRSDEACEHLAEIVRLAPVDAVTQFNLGVCLLREARVDDAIEHFQEAVELDPTYLNAQYHLARCLAQVGRTEDAIARYRVVLRLAEGYVDARVELASLLVQSGKKTEAITQLRRALELKFDHSDARRMLDELETQ